jgi:hypothetical protein
VPLTSIGAQIDLQAAADPTQSSILETKVSGATKVRRLLECSFTLCPLAVLNVTEIREAAS